MKAIVTGGLGFIGSHIVDHLIDEGHTVYIVDNESTGSQDNIYDALDKARPGQLILYKRDIRDPVIWKARIPRDADCVFHTAALARIQPSIEDPIEPHQVNVNGTLNVLEYCRDNGATIVFSGSSSIYSGEEVQANEDSPKGPKNPYALQKYMCEKYIELYHKLYGVSYKTMRYHNCYDDKTEVLTIDGFKLFKDVESDDYIATLNPETDELEYHKPLAKQRLPFDGELTHFDMSSVNLAVTPDHDLYVGRKNKQSRISVNYMFESDEATYSWRMKQDCKWRGKNTAYHTIPGVTLTDGRARSQHSDKHVPMDLWLRFMGWYLSEGSAFSGVVKRRSETDVKTEQYYRVNISKYKDVYPDEYDEILSVIKDMGFVPNESTDGRGITINSKQLYEHLAEFKGNKHIPKYIKELDSDLLETFFFTLMRGDGNNNGSTYSTVYKRFADDFQELLLKIGKAGSIRFEDGNRPIYRINIKNRNFQPIIGDQRTKEIFANKLQYSGYVYDLTVPNHIMLVRRNGKAVWSGNCYGERQIIDGKYVAVLGVFLKQRANGQPLTVVGDGSIRRDFTHVNDIVKGNIMSINWPDGAYNLGTSKNYSVLEIAKMMGGEIEYIPARPGEVQETRADISKALSCGWEPTIDIQTWIEENKDSAVE